MPEGTCSVAGCERPHTKRGWCDMHYKRWRKYGDPLTVKRPAKVEGPCAVDGCDRPHYANGVCKMHYQRVYLRGTLDLTAPSLAQRFEMYVERTDTCWLWSGDLQPNGYGRLSVGGAAHLAHRYSYETHIGPIPDGLEIDHLCRVRNCVRPDHLEPVTHAENVRRASEVVTHCKHGHEYTPENTLQKPSGSRSCKTCHREQQAARRKKRGISG